MYCGVIPATEQGLLRAGLQVKCGDFRTRQAGIPGDRKEKRPPIRQHLGPQVIDFAGSRIGFRHDLDLATR